MKRIITYSKNDIVVTLFCVLFLVMSIGAIGGGARQRAKDALCQSQLRQWGQIYSMFANDNGGKLVGWNTYAGEFMEHAWVPLMYPYYEDFDICLCPSATNLWTEVSFFSSPYAAWDMEYLEPEWFPYYFINGQGAYGSYGKNEWITNSSTNTSSPTWEYFYRTVYIANASEVPVFGDCSWMGGFPTVADDPALTRFHGPIDGHEVNRWNLDRHGKAVNMLFLDWSARKVGLRELWMLKWSRQEGWGDTDIVPDPEEPSDWPEWMRD